MKGIVWGATYECALIQINKIIEDYYKVNIEPKEVKNSKGDFSIIFNNGDLWRAFSANESRRGVACNISYIDNNISNDIIKRIILPCTKSYPYQAIKYFGEEIEIEKDKNE